MSKEAVSNVSYPVAPATTVLLTIDCQFGFGAGSWEQVPHADAAVENLRRASRAWRSCGGTVVHVQTVSSDLVAQLRARGVDTVVTGGLTTPICVQTTVDGLSMTGLKVIVLADACAAVQETDAFVAQVRALQPAAG
jgi:nicotinamidase-related amidase